MGATRPASGKNAAIIKYLSFGFNKCGLKAQCSTQPRASEATPWGFRIVESTRPVRAKALTLYVVILTCGLKVEHRMYFCSTPAPCLKAFALTGRDCFNTRYPGCRFACPGLWAPLGFQPALAKSKT